MAPFSCCAAETYCQIVYASRLAKSSPTNAIPKCTPFDIRRTRGSGAGELGFLGFRFLRSFTRADLS